MDRILESKESLGTKKQSKKIELNVYGILIYY